MCLHVRLSKPSSTGQNLHTAWVFHHRQLGGVWFKDAAFFSTFVGVFSVENRPFRQTHAHILSGKRACNELLALKTNAFPRFHLYIPFLYKPCLEKSVFVVDEMRKKSKLNPQSTTLHNERNARQDVEPNVRLSTHTGSGGEFRPQQTFVA